MIHVYLQAVLAVSPGAAGGDGSAKDGYHLFNPTPRELMRKMSTDRPDTTESPYTVDAGHFQVELSFADATVDRDADAETRSIAAAPMLLKAGALNSVDVQLGIDPYFWERSEPRDGGESETLDGFGDVVARVKWNLLGNDDEGIAFALMPFVKIPTASDDIGNGDVEGGIIAPLAIPLPHGFSCGLMAEIDFVRNGADDRYVTDFVHTGTISHALVGELSGFVEYAGFANLNHDEDYRGYFDAGLTYGVSADMILDGGLRVGLTDAADDFGCFLGMSFRY